MASISSEPFIQIIRFKIAPEKVDQLIGNVRGELDRWVKHQPGFVSANFHKSQDGKHVINYAQWKDETSFKAFLGHDEQEALRKAISDAGPERAEADSFELVFSLEA